MKKQPPEPQDQPINNHIRNLAHDLAKRTARKLFEPFQACGSQYAMEEIAIYPGTGVPVVMPVSGVVDQLHGYWVKFLTSVYEEEIARIVVENATKDGIINNIRSKEIQQMVEERFCVDNESQNRHKECTR